MIELRNVSKVFNESKQEVIAIDDIKVTFNDSESVAVVGYSGAGKSTVIRLINGLIRPSGGSVIIDGTDLNILSNKKINAVRQNIGMVFQSFNLLSSMTVYDNVKTALKIAKYPMDKMDTRVISLLKSVDILEKKNEYPKNLSGGQKQRVGIARALANNPKYLLLDEATSALDAKTTGEIVELLKKIKNENNLTIIFISHQISVVKDLCERIIVMDQGKIIEDSTTKNIFINPTHDVTKKLIDSVISDESIGGIKDVYRIIYTDSVSNESILSNVIKKYNVDINIVNAKMVDIQEEKYGYLYVNITGEDVSLAISELKSNGLEVTAI